jgi:glucokinase
MKVSVDLGGTNLRAALIDNGTCVIVKSIPCPAKEHADTIINCLTSLIAEVITDSTTGIGVGVPSIVDTKNGIVYDVANIPAWTEVHLKEILSKRFGVPVEINNDSNCFTLGESRFGGGRGYDNMVGITIGTGIGAGVIINGKLYSGQYAGAGEVGCLPYLDSDYEHHCSTPFFAKHNTTGYELMMRAKAGDAEAVMLWNTFGQNIGNLLKAVMFAYAPQAIILGGGIAKAFPQFADAMYSAMQDFPYRIILNQLKVIPAQLEDAALLGAASLVD